MMKTAPYNRASEKPQEARYPRTGMKVALPMFTWLLVAVSFAGGNLLAGGNSGKAPQSRATNAGPQKVYDQNVNVLSTRLLGGPHG